MLKTPKQKRSEATLKQILSVCEELIDKGSFEQASMQEIARAAGVSVGTLYQRFSRKADIVAYLVNQLQTKQDESLLAALDDVDGTLADRVHHLCALLVSAVRSNEGLLRTIAAAHLSGDSPLSEGTAAHSRSVIEEAARWLCADDADLDVHVCERVVGIMAFALQYRAIFPTPDTLFDSAAYEETLCDMAIQHLTNRA